MDNKKIGKLIAELRKKQGLTQQDLGDKVGVGFKAVSKWECGTTLPDITIINEVSKILGISTDELLTGELKEEIPNEENNNDDKDTKKVSPKLIVTISIITVILIFITSIFVYQNNKTYKYKVISGEKEEYYVDGIAYAKNDNISVTINEIRFKNEEFSKTIIQNYEYTITINNKIIFGYGYIDSMNLLEKPISIEKFSNTFNVSFDTKTNIKAKKMIENNIELKLKLLDNNKNEITKIISLLFEPTDTK